MLKPKKNVFKLYYFGANGRAQMIRALLNWSKVDWEDIKLDYEGFAKLESEGTLVECFNQVPALEYKGTFFSQSHAIEFYLGKKFKLLGADHEEEYEILSLIQTIEDLNTKLVTILRPSNDIEEKAQESNLKSYINDFIPTVLKVFEKKILKFNAANISEDKQIKYYLGKKLTLADFAFGTYFNNLINHPFRESLLKPILLKYAPTLSNYVNQLVNGEFEDYYTKIHNKNSIF